AAYPLSVHLLRSPGLPSFVPVHRRHWFLWKNFSASPHPCRLQCPSPFPRYRPALLSAQGIPQAIIWLLTEYICISSFFHFLYMRKAHSPLFPHCHSMMKGTVLSLFNKNCFYIQCICTIL